MKMISINDLTKKVMVFFIVLLMFGNTFKYSPPVIGVLAVSVLSIFFSYKKIKMGYIKQYLFMIIYILYVAVVASVTGGGYGAAITLVTGMMVCLAVKEMEFNKYDIVLISISMFYSVIYWVVKSPTFYNESFVNHWLGDGTYTNTNTVGHFLAYEGAFLFIILSLISKRWIRGFRWILSLICLWGIYNVRARMALLTLILFLLACFFMEKKPCEKRRIVKFLLYGSVLLEIVFPIFYIWLYKNGIGENIKMFGLAEKGLYSGRETIWINAFEYFDTLPKLLFGVGSAHDFWEGHVLNMHNNAMNLLVVSGIIGLVLYFVWIISYINKTFDYDSKSMFKWQCLLFFVCIVFEGVSDITLFYNNFILYYFVALGIALSDKYQFDYGGNQ